MRAARRTAILSPTQLWETVSAARDTRDGAWEALQLLRRCSVPNVVTPERIAALGVRAAEGCFGNRLFLLYVCTLGMRPETAVYRNK